MRWSPSIHHNHPWPAPFPIPHFLHSPRSFTTESGAIFQDLALNVPSFAHLFVSCQLAGESSRKRWRTRRSLNLLIQPPSCPCDYIIIIPFLLLFVHVKCISRVGTSGTFCPLPLCPTNQLYQEWMEWKMPSPTKLTARLSLSLCSSRYQCNLITGFNATVKWDGWWGDGVQRQRALTTEVVKDWHGASSNIGGREGLRPQVRKCAIYSLFLSCCIVYPWMDEWLSDPIYV